MSTPTRALIPGLVLAAFATGALLAQVAADPAPAVKARQAHMQLYAFNLGQLGAMAQDKAPYDAAVATAAAENLAALAHMNPSAFWPAGSAQGEVEGSRALPALWENFPDVGAKAGALRDASTAMVVAASSSLDDLKAAMGPLGGACQGCHQDYRASAN